MAQSFREWQITNRGVAEMAARDAGTGHHPSLCSERCPCKTQFGRVTRTGSYCTEDGVESGTVEHRPAIGVPYAVIDVDTGERICPVCEGRFPEEYDADGEMLTFNYAEHYQRAHGG